MIFFNSSMRKLISDASFTGASQLIYAISLILVQVLAVRHTSVKDFGDFVIANTIESIIEVVFISKSSELAFQYLGKYWISNDFTAAKICANRIIKIDLATNVSITIIVSFISLILGKILNFNPFYILILILQIPSQIGYGVYKSIFVCASKVKQQAIVEIVFSTFQLVVCSISIIQIGIYGLLFSYPILALVKNLISYWITRKWWGDIDHKLLSSKEYHSNIINSKSWLYFSFHSIIRNIFNHSSGQVDVLLLSLRGAEAVAVYKIAKSLASLPIRVIGPIWNATRPKIIESYHKKEYNRLRKIIGIPSFLMLAFSIPSFIVLLLIADQLFINIYGNIYASATQPFLILLIGNTALGALTGWFKFWIVISKFNTLGTINSVLFLSLSLFLGYIFGVNSATNMATVMSLSYLVSSLLSWTLFLIDTNSKRTSSDSYLSYQK